MDIFNYIKIGGVDFYRPADLSIKRTAQIQAEYTSCTGKVYGDIIGAKYDDDMNLQWDYLTDAMVQKLSSLIGQTTEIEFTDSTGATITETILVESLGGNPSRKTRADGTAVFTGLEASVKFIGAAE